MTFIYSEKYAGQIERLYAVHYVYLYVLMTNGNIISHLSGNAACYGKVIIVLHCEHLLVTYPNESYT